MKEVGDKTFQNDVKFTGAVQDTSTGLHYMNSRYYSSDTGRFISQDTYSGNVFDPWTQHLYTYTSNNPINFVDPTGHFDVDPDGNKILPTGKYIAAPSKPSTSYRSTPSSHKQSKPSAQRAKAKVQAKSSGSSSKQRSIKQWVQTGLDLAGNAPGPLGAVSDGVNALIYLADGDYQNAALSGVAVLPGGSILKNGIKAGRTSSKILKGTGKVKDINKGVNFTKTSGQHMDEIGRYVPTSLQIDTIKSTKGIPDPRGSDAMMHYSTIYRNGKKYNLEVLYDERTNTIFHFEYARKAMGPLPAIPKKK
ncbi:hypothetical protein LCL96_01550 [Rossellomorea aquimaris]|nr:hypothetical protein [Rossellomorea aquimaris]